jgi:mRNA interferase YafQ
MYRVRPTKPYKRDLKRISHKPEIIAEIDAVVALLSADDNPLPEKYQDHQLKGKYAAYRECHVRPEWLLVYQKNKNELILLLARTNTHSEVFG